VIEVISPGSAIYDRNTKADTYAALGVKELWLVDQGSKTIEVRLLRGNQYGPSVTLERNDDLKCYVLPGFVFEVGSVFDD
jgi:Uma2 family endonuclease